MTKKRLIRIGLLGFGTVGQGVWKHIMSNRQALELRLGVRLELVRAAVQNPNKKRAIRIPKSKLTDNPLRIVDDPNIDIVCELMGGTSDAKALTLKAFKRGKTVVTANKALICEHGATLFKTARQSGGHYFFEASVAGGVPIIKTLCEGLVANRFKLIYGILNGTSNYILTRMERDGATLDAVLKDARRLGYVEADEALDLDGWDAAHKIAILAYLAHGKWVSPAQMKVEGIRNITPTDIDYARSLGYKIKLLAKVERDLTKGDLSVAVHPTLIPSANTIANVDGVYNGISLSGDVVGTTVLIGRGAGQDATASAVISDIADAVLALLGRPSHTIFEEDAKRLSKCSLAKPENIRGRYYLRLTVKDEPGVLARVAQSFAKEAISIATMIQSEDVETQTATLIFTTHTSNEKSIASAFSRLRRFKSILEPPVLFRIFDPQD